MISGIHRFFALATPETEIEVDDIDFRPGRSVRMLVRQPGPVFLEDLAVDLRCRETTWEYERYWVEEDGWAIPAQEGRPSSTSRLVTETKTNRHHHDLPVLKRTGLDVRESFEETVALTIPDFALPTGKIRDRAVEWQIVVTGKVGGRADFEHPFPVVIRPA